VSGPVEAGEASTGVTDGPVLRLEPSREAKVGDTTVRRALPRRGHRTVGAWCFADHLGPVPADGGLGTGIGPHPHIGLQTVTWLVDGEILHRDSLGVEQLIRPGQLNLMTAGRGVAHAEEGTAGSAGRPKHGIQLWVAQPEATRHGEPAFEHHADLPRVELDEGEASVLVGTFAGVTSPARADTDHVGAELRLGAGRSVVPLHPEHEHALVVLAGDVEVEGEVLAPGVLAYLGRARDELALTAAADVRLVLLGGMPFEDELLMWWNFVARTRDEVEAARDAWQADDRSRFPEVSSRLGRIAAPGLPWPRD
jgi:redox-sensitive bicupin YhaK (pirin superfamily)